MRHFFFFDLLITLIAALVPLVACPKQAFAISIDSLQEAQSATAGGADNRTILETSGAIGGFRDVAATSVSGGPVSSSIGAGKLTHTQFATDAMTTYIWDGNPQPGVQSAGLGGVDFTGDGATAFRVVVGSYNFPEQVPLSITLSIYDSQNSLGASVATVSLAQAVASGGGELVLLIPFSSFNAVPGGVAAQFTQVGAITMNISGGAVQAIEHVLTLNGLGTNGECQHTPQNRLVKDSCGVCNGNNTTCSLDCLGVPNGQAVPGSFCTTGSLGACSPGYYSGGPAQFCECVADKVPEVESCDGADNDCDGLVDEDFNLGTVCSNGVGACSKPGTRICASDGKSAICSFPSRLPSPEVCDSIDNDCDGLTDEDFFAGVNCTVGVGACKRTGVNICTTLGSSACSVTEGAPQEEICDGIDNDCDGLVDEDSPQTGPLVGQCGMCGSTSTDCLDCNGVPNGPSRLDACNVCGGNGTSCLDCNGVVNGGAVKDDCGICGGNGTTCRDCRGIQNGTAKVDVCNVCGGNGASCLDCNGVPNGSAVKDICNVCGGNGTSCLDCNGVPNGSAQLDICNVCGGDGTSCLDCRGIVNGGAVRDACNVCGGDGSTCRDCKGVINGSAKIDACNVCGGDGKSCIDCNGVVNGAAQVDECGVCGGDNLSCVVCSTVDLSPVLGSLDSGAKRQQSIVRKAASILLAIPAARKETAYVKRILETAQAEQVESWNLSWSLPVQSTTCTTTTSLCVASSNQPVLDAYKQNNIDLKNLALGVMNRVKLYRPRRKLSTSDKRVIMAATAQFTDNLALVSTVPVQQLTCSSVK